MNEKKVLPGAPALPAQLSLGKLMLYVYRGYSALTMQKLKAEGYEGLGLAHVSVLAYLDNDGTRIVTLADRVGATKQYIGRLVQELEEAGYLTIEDDPADRRASLVKATERGTRFKLDAMAGKQQVEAEFADLLGEERMASLMDCLRILLEHLPNDEDSKVASVMEQLYGGKTR
ncbi:MAG: MarR family transcriptional regulator [bacterium]|nr:MarR family transcriptional regulator [bacterium]